MNEQRYDDAMVPVTVRILEREYQVACPPDERQALLDSAQYLNDKMKQIRDTGKVVGVDRIAVMAALNLANEVLQKQDAEPAAQDTQNKLRALNEKLDNALGEDTNSD